ncbi:ATP-binding protein [Elizabethkingia anophelis]|uniref:ATP-binding protein n=1 Tax=Elizabethkingia anophelis TaxID=1117645 RepID=UPI000D02FB11|nr:ATP-binding protein [Elizabethkingia anophelis]MYY46423.1 ATP-binding protein [Elizabethkingia anophelis]PRQ84159.1 ATP-binding protein [Elizabethkingia anophelis]PRQ85059.1 ATP-binding protein [Elizabethkingia anophelis]
MRYLSKIVFINSADKSLKYSEVDLDGNVHFIGTQGVGKSTLLRAILFFYNADTQKLGISREKKNYNEYYFPYQNSYIIYEVQTETGKYCVLSFKSQGRVAFRFINSGYDKDFFLDNEGKAYETFDKIREALGKIDSTRIINNYEEYRNILYGNNKGLQSEFRKYALIESKQFQNIPRTIGNVFLNTKLDAEFVKETIIKSLNEDEIKIDLTTYSQTHLRDFESNLNDIKKWTEGKIDKQAEKVATTYSALKHLEQKRKELSYQLGFALNKVKEQQPKVQEQLRSEELKQDKVHQKLDDLDKDFGKKKDDILKQIGEVGSKLKDIKTKREEYLILKIETILERVAQKPSLDLEEKNLLEEKNILTSKFLEIQQRFEAQIRQLENQLKEFKNNKQTEKNKAEKDFNAFEKELNQQYDLIYDDIRQQNKEALETAYDNVKAKEKAITNQKIKLSEAKHKRFFEAEITNCKNAIETVKSNISNAETQIQQANDRIKSFQNEWEFEKKNHEADTERKIERKLEENEKLNLKITAIDVKIENSKNSFYGWLNDNVPDWEKTIGKVIDEENVLFQQGLNPKKIADANMSFYGIEIDILEINKNVKTVSDLQNEQVDFKNKIQFIKQSIQRLQSDLNDDLDKLKRKFHPKIKEQKEIIQNNEYIQGTGKSKLDEFSVSLLELENKAKSEQKSVIESIETNIAKLSEEKIKAEEHVQKITSGITRAIDTKRKEKTATQKEEQLKLSDILQKLDAQIQQESKNINTKSETIKSVQKQELETKGADTKRIDAIDLRVSETRKELLFIESNLSVTERYKYDKEQLFDRESEFRNNKTLLDKKLENETEKHRQQKDKLVQQIGIHKAEIEALNKISELLKSDLTAFENFTKTEIYPAVEHFISSYSKEHKTEQNCVLLTNEIQTTDNTTTKHYIELQEAINKFTGNFQENNLFSFNVKFVEKSNYFDFAEMLKEFVDENKITEYKQRVEERFAHIIRQIGRETNSLIEKEGEISKIISDINDDFVTRNFVGAIKSMELKTIESKNKIFTLLVEIKHFNDENTFDLGKPDLFSTDGLSNKNEKAISLLVQLVKEMTVSKEKEITLSDSFELLFKIVENDNDTGWVEKLTNVGSEGTDILVKAMINIMLLNVFKGKASKKQKDDFRLHCMMDEIGKLHPNNVKGILKFANDRNILLINSSPTSLNAMDYRYTYLLAKDRKNVTSIKRLVKKIVKTEA